MCSFQDADYVVSRARCLIDDFAEVFAESVMCHPAMHFDCKPRNVGEADRVVWFGENGFA